MSSRDKSIIYIDIHYLYVYIGVYKCNVYAIAYEHSEYAVFSSHKRRNTLGGGATERIARVKYRDPYTHTYSEHSCFECISC